jgi:hypothetical protein
MHYIYQGYHMYLALKNILSISCYIRFLVNKHRTYQRHKIYPDDLPIAASLCFFFITLSSLLNGFLKPSSAAAISLSFLCAARRSSKLQNSQQRIS